MLALWISTATFAAVSPGDRWIGNSNLNVGLHQDGSLVNSDIDLGILWDPDGPDGPMPMTGDMIRVGWYWDGWAWSYSGDDGFEDGFQAGPRDAGSSMTWTDKSANSALSVLKSEMDIGDVNLVLESIVLKRSDLLIQNFTFTASDDITDLWVGRTIDPDQDEWLLDSYDTDNESGDGWATASSLYDERTIGLAGGVLDGVLGEGGICGWCDSTESMAEDSWESSTDDHQINVLVDAGDVNDGDSITVRFVYAFEVGAIAAKNASLTALGLMDIDGDGLTVDEGDCDDLHPDVYPDATELTDGLDNDCDGDIDEDTLDSDDDGDGFSEAEGDCDDANPDVYPGAGPADGVSNADCDGVAEEGSDPDPEEEPEEDTGEPIEDDPEDESEQDTGPSEEDEEPGEGTDTDAESGEDSESESDDESTSDGIVAGGEKHQACSQVAGRSVSWLWCVGLIALARRRGGKQ